MTVVVCSQCLYEPSDFSVYEVGRGSGPGGDPGPGYDHRGGGDQAHVALGQTEDPAQVRDIFDSNLAGEVTL